MKAASVFTSLLSLSSLVAAFPWPEAGSDIIAAAAPGLERMLYRRQDNNGNDSPQQTTPPTTTANNNKPTATGKSKSDSNNNSASNSGASASGTSSPSGTSGNNNNASSYTTQYAANDPPGGVQMVTPAPFAGAQFYKVGDWVTFAWNFTSLSSTPHALDILATIASGQQTYTIATNQSVSGPTGTVLWDTGAYQQQAQVPLLTNEYTLVIYDAKGDVTDVPKPGYFAPQSTFTFGMYTKQAYTPWKSYNCATCNSGMRMSSMERQTWLFLFGMAGISVASFTWFATGVFGVL